MKTILVTSRSVTIERSNTDIYWTSAPYDVLLNGEVVKSQETKNVTSIYNLTPDTTYTVVVNNEKLSFKTLLESVTLNVKDFHAIGDGITDDTSAIQAAIMCCPADGRVLIPAGTYLIKPLFLKSNVRIELAKNATLLGVTERNLYPILPGRLPSQLDDDEEFYFGTWEGKAESAFAGLITGINVENVMIYGEGVVNGNANKSDWWENDLVKRIAWRPRGIFLNRCKNIVLQGITVENTASWNQHCFFSKNVSYVDMKLFNPEENPNTDGINPESCDGVLIVGCHFSCGDDCIAIKSGKAEMGKKLKTACENIVVRNCLMQHGHGAVTLGSEMSAGLKNITVSQCHFAMTDRGLRIKTNRGRGNLAIIDDVVFENISMDNVMAPLVINMFYKARINAPDTEYRYNPNPMPVDARTPYLGSFTFKNMTAKNVEWAAGKFWGLPEQPIKSVTIEDVSFSIKDKATPGQAAMTLNGPTYCKAGLQFINVENVKLKNVQVVDADGEEFVFTNVANQTIE